MDIVFTYKNLDAFLKMLPQHKDISFSKCENLISLIGIDSLYSAGKIKVFAKCDNCQQNCDFYIKFEDEDMSYPQIIHSNTKP